VAFNGKRPVHESGPGPGARGELHSNDAGAELDLSPGERATIDAILAGAAGQVREFTPLRAGMEVWGEETRARTAA